MNQVDPEAQRITREVRGCDQQTSSEDFAPVKNLCYSKNNERSVKNNA